METVEQMFDQLIWGTFCLLFVSPPVSYIDAGTHVDTDANSCERAGKISLARGIKKCVWFFKLLLLLLVQLTRYELFLACVINN